MSEYRIPAFFELGETLDCGQAFRWKETDGVWTAVAFDKLLSIKKEDSELVLSCTKDEYETIWKKYFDIETDYEKIKKEIEKVSPVLKDAIKYAPGIRILRQEPWEALCSFIFSQNNNIPRIKGIVERFCDNFGEDISGHKAFPKAEKIASLCEEELAPIRSGFRAKYIMSAADFVASGKINLNDLYTMPLDEAKNELMKIKGVGPKVSDCVLLYGLYRTECFPLDVWMKRAMEVLLPNNKPEDFGKNAGIAQQYIFHYSRMNADLF
ncbi:MAG: DNA glycosylase [Clostridia bacterium]